MAHAISKRKNGMYEMAYVGEKPWHGLGQELTPDAPLETWATEAGMDWTVQRSYVRYATGMSAAGPVLREWKDWHTLFRSDSGDPLGMVSSEYKVVQPRDVLEFFRDLLEVLGWKMCTAGTLHGGRKFWAMADINADYSLLGVDRLVGRLLFATAVDGSMRNIIKNVVERVVCANTLAIALGETGAVEVQVSHRSHFDEAKVKKQLGIAVDSFQRFMKVAQDLCSKDMSPMQAEANTVALLAKDAKLQQAIAEVGARNVLRDRGEMQLEYQAVKQTSGYRKIMALFDGHARGAGLATADGTAWGWVNSVTEYYDHHFGARTVDNRMASAWFGFGDAQKKKALQLAQVDA